MGIQDLKDVVAFGAKFGNGIGESLSDDGKITLGDMANFMPAVLSVPAALEGIENIPAEIKDLDEAELVELVAFVDEEFDIPQDDAEEFIEESLHVASVVLAYVKKYFW